MEVDSFISRGRFLFFIAVIIIFTGLLIFQFAKYMIMKEPAVITPKISTERGTIYDRNKKILAVQTTVYNLYADKSLMKNPAEAAKVLSPILMQSESELLEKIQDSKSNFLYLKKRMSESERDLVKTVIDENKLSGLRFESVFNRTYPENTLASTVVGFLGDDGRGKTGVEYSLQNILSPPPETKGYTGKGYDVYLSIDGNIQYMLEKIISKTMEETKAESAIFLAVDAKTGEILAYVNSPSASLANFIESTPEERLDRPANYVYEPGSVFKIFSMAAFLELGSTKDGQVYDCNALFEFNRSNVKPITCLRPHGRVSPRDVIRLSCNDATAQIADITEKNAFYEKIKLFGFGSKTNIELPGETAGLISPPQNWSVRTKHTIAIGQEVGVSALQLVEAATAFTNKGSTLRLSLISKIADKEGNIVYLHRPSILNKVISEKNAALLLSYMITGSIEGIAWRASINGVPIAVKTGTAQMANKKGGGYSKTDFISSCIGIFPADDPKIILYTAVIKPVGQIYGSIIAAPLISEASNEIIDYLGLARENAPTIEHTGRIPISENKPVVLKDKMPDLKGVPKKLLLELLLQKDFSVKITGDGYVVSQYPPPGTPIKKGMKIELNLE
ncbi:MULTISPECIES: penicillin-binding protein [unclassified Treponema]|uniref:penicillin-binding protein n=1 Tax=unclassified Treponema TaxID=2638727 RepID=UPI0020A44EC9|nr:MULTISPECIES: penicillin-binding protein [unclassified Treponema]UTC67775.1 transpeptidase family protein [Treponema sp. OMZ 789]UTC70500.1 transpeptidase family protein [Treponema sp. OMZ 790]UTC73212.1 transpeptidase family protein [Treponema sp. OMZ 791]